MTAKQYETANIKYCGLTDGKFTVTLLDENKGKWTIYKKGYQTTEDSEPYQALQNFKFGDIFGVSYQQKEESFTNDAGKLITFMKKTIYSIMLPVAQPTATMQTSKPYIPQQDAPSKDFVLQARVDNGYITTEPKNDKFWDKKGLEKCLWNFWNDHYPVSDLNWKEEVAQAFDEITEFADKRFSDAEKPEVDPNSIPF